MHNKRDKFSSKILLFGEYTIIKGSKGLAFPLEQYAGCFAQAEEVRDIEEHFQLDKFCQHMQQSDLLMKCLDLKHFENDIQQGYYFKSNIPYGYGIGSSGALCAAVYARYAYDFKPKSAYTSQELHHLKSVLAEMEGFYHGTSSGLDCLISLVDKAVLIEGKQDFKVVEQPDLSMFGQFYLYDSEHSRKTAPLVEIFLQKCNEGQEYAHENKLMSRIVNQLIDDTVGQNKAAFLDGFRKLSHLQYRHFCDLIPNDIKEIWKKGLETDTYFMKLCGAGGGGFFLIYSADNTYNENCSYLRI